MPVVLLCAAVKSEVLFEGLVRALASAICLQVVGSADILSYVQDFA